MLIYEATATIIKQNKKVLQTHVRTHTSHFVHITHMLIYKARATIIKQNKKVVQTHVRTHTLHFIQIRHANLQVKQFTLLFYKQRKLKLPKCTKHFKTLFSN
jgi:hypothetical protein